MILVNTLNALSLVSVKKSNRRRKIPMLGFARIINFNQQISKIYVRHYPANIYLFKVNNRNTRKRYEISSKLTITPERRQ